MTARDTFRMAAANLVRRKGRTLLTVIGVVIGVGALVLMVSLGIGLKLQFTKMFESEDLLRTVTVTRVEGGSKKRPKMGMWGGAGQLLPITEEELKQIRLIEGVEDAYPDLLFFLAGKIPLAHPVDGSSEVADNFIPVGGVTPKEEVRYRSILVKGRLWSSPDEHACLLPTGFLERHFGLTFEDVALEQPLIFSRDVEPAPPPGALSFKIVGIVDSEKLGLKGGQVYLPMARALELRDVTQGGVTFIPYKKGTYPSVEVVVRDAREVNDVKSRLKNSGYEAMAAADVLDLLNTIFLVVEGFLACIGAVGLLVALFGIANTMAMSVLERTREIGIMKALGARNREIRRLFLLEAGWIGAVGGVIGLAGGWALGLLANAIGRRLLETPTTARFFHVSLWLVAGSIGFSILVSVIAGVIPAVRASRMDPVQALRYE